MSLAAIFEVPEGTMRTALSRMVGAGELSNDRGVYSLSGRLLGRQRFQSEGRGHPRQDWNGAWLMVTVSAERRSVAARRSFRSEMATARLGELRPDTWLRPDNLGPELVERLAMLDDVIVVRGELSGASPFASVGQLWELDELGTAGRRLLEAMRSTADDLDGEDPSLLPDAFAISAAVVRFLTVEPQLPPQLEPAAWPAHELRSTYDHYERAFQRLLHTFLRSQ